MRTLPGHLRDVGIEMVVDRTVLTEGLISVVLVMESTSRVSDSPCATVLTILHVSCEDTVGGVVSAWCHAQ